MKRIIVAASLLAVVGWTGCEPQSPEEPEEPETTVGEEAPETGQADVETERADAETEQADAEPRQADAETGQVDADAAAEPRADTTDDAAAAGATVRIRRHETLGAYLVDADGRSLYMFEDDPRGTSTCYDACADAWPPFTTEAGVSAGTRVDETELDTTERRGGQTQVTYAGNPLYYFARDREAGDIDGHRTESFGGEWYLVSPEGEKVKRQGQQEQN